MYAPSRGMNAELNEGMTDGLYKKVNGGVRGGVVDRETYEARSFLDDVYYGIHEVKVKVTPDGLLHATPDYQPTKELNRLKW